MVEIENTTSEAEEVSEEVFENETQQVNEELQQPEAETNAEEVQAEEEADCANEDVVIETENEIESLECEKEPECTLNDVLASLDSMNVKIEQMNQLFVQKIQHTTHEERIVDQMHAELQKYKSDMYSQLVRPILLDIIDIRDSIIRMSNNFALKPEGEQSVPLATFSGYAYDVQDILEKNNISIYDSKDGDEFNALKQKIVKKVTTPVEQLHGKIAESLSSGYDYMGKTISPEKVAVYIYQKTEDAEGEN